MKSTLEARCFSIPFRGTARAKSCTWYYSLKCHYLLVLAIQDTGEYFSLNGWLCWTECLPDCVANMKRSSTRIQCTASKTAIDSTKFKSPPLSGLFKSVEGIHKGRWDSSQPGIPDTLTLLFAVYSTFRWVSQPATCLYIALWSAAPGVTYAYMVVSKSPTSVCKWLSLLGVWWSGNLCRRFILFCKLAFLIYYLTLPVHFHSSSAHPFSHFDSSDATADSNW